MGAGHGQVDCEPGQIWKEAAAAVLIWVVCPVPFLVLEP